MCLSSDIEVSNNDFFVIVVHGSFDEKEDKEIKKIIRKILIQHIKNIEITET